LVEYQDGILSLGQLRCDRVEELLSLGLIFRDNEP